MFRVQEGAGCSRLEGAGLGVGMGMRGLEYRMEFGTPVTLISREVAARFTWPQVHEQPVRCHVLPSCLQALSLQLPLITVPGQWELQSCNPNGTKAGKPAIGLGHGSQEALKGRKRGN